MARHAGSEKGLATDAATLERRALQESLNLLGLGIHRSLQHEVDVAVIVHAVGDFGGNRLGARERDRREVDGVVARNSGDKLVDLQAQIA